MALIIEHDDETCDECFYVEVFVGQCYFVEIFADGCL